MSPGHSSHLRSCEKKAKDQKMNRNIVRNQSDGPFGRLSKFMDSTIVEKTHLTLLGVFDVNEKLSIQHYISNESVSL
jgi:hypothetical protein